MGRKGGLIGGIVGYLLGLFFKSFILVMITLKVPSLETYLTNTFIPASGVDIIRFLTVPLPFALLGASIGVLMPRGRTEAPTTAATPES
jgi:hypothetical protein